MKRGLKLLTSEHLDPLQKVRTQAPMKRGLKPLHQVRHVAALVGPNPGPDEEGIETLLTWTMRRPSDVRTQAPMKRGLKLEKMLSLNRGRQSPNPGPDEEGIETTFLRPE